MARKSVLLAIAAASLLVGCGVQFQNTRAAQELEQRSRPPGSIYIGWRVFQDKCARCHGVDAGGGAGPDLLARVRTLGAHRFVDVVLTRYEWPDPVAPAAAAGRAGAERQAWIDDIVQRRRGALVMPAWQGEPRVEANVMDLYAWLSARAEGTQGPGRPARP